MAGRNEIVEFLDGFLRVKDLGEDTGLAVCGSEKVEVVCGAVDLSFHAIELVTTSRYDLFFTHLSAERIAREM